MKIGMLFHKNPLAPPASIDIIRLRAISKNLLKRGFDVEIISPVTKGGSIDDTIPIRPLSFLREGCYDILKTCYHFSLEHIGDYKGPLISRIVRVVDGKLPERDEKYRKRLMKCQEIIKERSQYLILNNRENEERWHSLYGNCPPVILVPTGCPEIIPLPGKNPFPENEKSIIFLGSLAAPRMVSIINDFALRLEGMARIHLVGLNKADLYSNGELQSLNPLIVRHGELLEENAWDYIYYAGAGLAIAAGPYSFDNDISKIINYLRGGLPVLSEEMIINNNLIQKTGLGKIYQYDSIDDMVKKALYLLDNPFSVKERALAMEYMANEHSWERRVDIYEHMFMNRGFVDSEA